MGLLESAGRCNRSEEKKKTGALTNNAELCSLKLRVCVDPCLLPDMPGHLASRQSVLAKFHTRRLFGILQHRSTSLSRCFDTQKERTINRQKERQRLMERSRKMGVDVHR
mmetsp:Transcript_16320/g.33141  ORF Transcript_16320/g.33141 Transcript_16320/m.33141 type:complete len:110 (-) Transcript_16320:347-676(-)